jgi:polysaccharide export outer membrane protein
MKTILYSGCMGALVLALAGCASSKSDFTDTAPAPAPKPVVVKNDIDPKLLEPDAGLMTLGPGDVLEVELIGSPETRTTAKVGPDGKIYFSLLPGMDVWGMNLPEAKAAIERELSRYQNSPRIMLSLRAVGSKQVWVLGRLTRPGVYPITGPTTLLEAIAQAGGTSRSESQISTAEISDLRHSFVVRKGEFVPVNFDRLLRHGDMTQNIYLQSGDFVYVPFSGSREVYVMGAVKFPRALPYVDQMSVVSAIAGTSGMTSYDILERNDNGVTTQNADLSHVAIVRGSLSEPQVIIVNYHDIIKGNASDVMLEPGDIVHVPNSPYTTLKRYVNLIVNTFSTTVAANEGVRAAGGTANVGVSVPVGK